MQLPARKAHTPSAAPMEPVRVSSVATLTVTMDGWMLEKSVVEVGATVVSNVSTAACWTQSDPPMALQQSRMPESTPNFQGSAPPSATHESLHAPISNAHHSASAQAQPVYTSAQSQVDPSARTRLTGVAWPSVTDAGVMEVNKESDVA